MKWPWVEIALILVVVCAYNLSVAVPFANHPVQDHHKSKGHNTMLIDERFKRLSDSNKMGSGWQGSPHNQENEPEDNEKGDVPDDWKPKVKRNIIYSNCRHPETNKKLQHGSFSYNKATCLMCVCPFGHLKCNYAC